jgi:hypothetical protein
MSCTSAPGSAKSADRVRSGRCNLRERRGDPAERRLARPAQRWRPADPAADLGQRLRRKPRKHTDQRRGAVFGIKRRGNEFLAKWLSAVAIFPCEGARDAASEGALAAAFEKGGWERVTRLYRRGDLPDEQCWLNAPDWALAYA